MTLDLLNLNYEHFALYKKSFFFFHVLKLTLTEQLVSSLSSLNDLFHSINVNISVMLFLNVRSYFVLEEVNADSCLQLAVVSGVENRVS